MSRNTTRSNPASGRDEDRDFVPPVNLRERQRSRAALVRLPPAEFDKTIDTVRFSDVADEARFWARVEVTDGCWEWQGSKDRYGYGRYWVDGKHLRAHRVAFELGVGPIPDGDWVLHDCDNRACVRPDHLHLGDARKNAQEREARGRSCVRRGEDHHNAQLTEAKVFEIRRREASGVFSRQLAEEYGVSYSAIRDIVTGRTWRQPDIAQRPRDEHAEAAD